jgi:hypothetical protein
MDEEVTVDESPLALDRFVSEAEMGGTTSLRIEVVDDRVTRRGLELIGVMLLVIWYSSAVLKIAKSWFKEDL